MWPYNFKVLNLIPFLLFQFPFNYFSRLHSSVSVMSPSFCHLISILLILPSLLVKALNKIIASTQYLKVSSENLFTSPSPVHWHPLIASHPLTYLVATVLPLFFRWTEHFLWNILLRISLTFKWANLTSKSAVSRGWMYVTTKNSFPYQWQRRKCFSLYDIKVHH